MVGRLLVNGFDVVGQSFAFINLLKRSNNRQAGSFAYPGILDDNGYPTTAPSTALTQSVFIPTEDAYPSFRFILKQASGTSGVWGNVSLTLPAGTITVNSGAAFVVSNSGNVITVSGTNPYLDLTFNGLSGAANAYNLTLSFLTTGGAYTTPDMVLCRADHESLLDAGEIFNPDFIALLQDLNPKILRLMDWSAVNGSNSSQHDYRSPVTAISYRMGRWQPSAWVGGISASGNDYTCSAPSDWSTLSAPYSSGSGSSHGNTIQGKFGGSLSGNLTVTSASSGTGGVIRLAMADTSSLSNDQRIAFSSSGGLSNGGGIWNITVVDATHVELQGSTYSSNVTGTISVAKITVGANSAKLLRGSSGIPSITSGDLSTLVYDALTDTFLVTPRAIGDSSAVGATNNGAVPIEIQVALANKLNVNLWTCIPFWYTDGSVTAIATYVRDNLNSWLTCYYEPSNEISNFGFTQFYHCQMSGTACGFPASRAVVSFNGLRSRMMFGLLDAVYSATNQTNYHKLLCSLLELDDPTTSQTYKWNGNDLAPSGTGTGVGNTTYSNYTGAANYTQSPNRPIDFADGVTYGAYFCGGLLNDTDSYQFFPSGVSSAMTDAADAFAAGNVATAFAWCDSDLQSGSPPSGGALNANLDHVKARATLWHNKAASYDGSRATPLTVEGYEGGYTGWGPTTTNCTSMGISTTYGNTENNAVRGKIQLMLDAYKQSFNFYQKVTTYYDDFFSLPNAGTPPWFLIQGSESTTNTRWSMLNGSTYAGPTRLGSSFSGGDYASYDAFRNYNNRKRRLRVTT